MQSRVFDPDKRLPNSRAARAMGSACRQGEQQQLLPWAAYSEGRRATRLPVPALLPDTWQLKGETKGAEAPAACQMHTMEATADEGKTSEVRCERTGRAAGEELERTAGLGEVHTKASEGKVQDCSDPICAEPMGMGGRMASLRRGLHLRGRQCATKMAMLGRHGAASSVDRPCVGLRSGLGRPFLAGTSWDTSALASHRDLLVLDSSQPLGKRQHEQDSLVQPAKRRRSFRRAQAVGLDERPCRKRYWAYV